MDTQELGGILSKAARDVFQTMLDTDLEQGEPSVNSDPFMEAEVTGFIALTGSVVGFVSIHGTRDQCRDFTARLMGGELDDVKDDEEIRDGVGEITNMIAGGVKSALSESGSLEIGLPTVVMSPSSTTKVADARSVVVACEDYTGAFHVELVVGGANREG